MLFLIMFFSCLDVLLEKHIYRFFNEYYMPIQFVVQADDTIFYNDNTHKISKVEILFGSIFNTNDDIIISDDDIFNTNDDIIISDDDIIISDDVIVWKKIFQNGKKVFSTNIIEKIEMEEKNMLLGKDEVLNYCYVHIKKIKLQDYNDNTILRSYNKIFPVKIISNEGQIEEEADTKKSEKLIDYIFFVNIKSILKKISVLQQKQEIIWFSSGENGGNSEYFSNKQKENSNLNKIPCFNFYAMKKRDVVKTSIEITNDNIVDNSKRLALYIFATTCVDQYEKKTFVEILEKIIIFNKKKIRFTKIIPKKNIFLYLEDINGSNNFILSENLNTSNNDDPMYLELKLELEEKTKKNMVFFTENKGNISIKIEKEKKEGEQ